ncbi:hypothetical protein Tco_0111234 [Tanacetum coccineum]
MSAKDTIAVQRCGLSAKELNEFLSFYPIPSEYDVILPTSTQTIFDAPPGYVGLYTHSFSLANLRLPLTDFFCEVLQYFKVHISRLNPFGCAKLTTFIIMCKAYGCEPSVDLFRAGLQPSWEFSQQWPALIVGGKGADPGFGIGSPSASVNTEFPKYVEEPKVQPAKVIAKSGESPKAGVFVVHPGSVAARIKERKCKMRGGSSRLPVKRKQASESSSSRAICAKTSASKDDAPILSISNDDKGKFLAVVDNAINKRAREFLQVIKKMSSEADVIKARERSHKEECEELQVKCKVSMKEFDQNPAVLALREKISSLTVDVKEHKGNLDRMMLESQKWVGYHVTLLTFELKVDSLEAENARLEAVEASLRREVEELKQDRRDVVSKVVRYDSMELVHCDELVRLVGTLVSSAITYGRCRAYEQVASMKEPFDLSKVKVYRSSYKKEHTQASNDFATATFLWLDEFVADAAASIEALLSKKPPTL